MQLHLVGGFLGTGKTTAIVAACHALKEMGVVSAVITNDQGSQQVDSKFVRSEGLPGMEVSEGCFCCQYDRLEGGIEGLMATLHPDVIFAESVGSCTDLIATVAKPFSQKHPDVTLIVSIFADATLLRSTIEGTSLFIDENVRYILKKQLEEADLLIVNKTDLVSLKECERIRTVLAIEYPGKKVLFQNSTDKKNIRNWLKEAERRMEQSRKSLTINYDKYALGEAALSWMDATLEIVARRLNALPAARAMIGAFNEKIRNLELTVGHLKYFLDAEGERVKVSCTMHQDTDLDLLPDSPAGHCLVLFNARVQTEPETLKALLDAVMQEIRIRFDCRVQLGAWKTFRPAYPIPQHRVGD